LQKNRENAKRINFKMDFSKKYFMFFKSHFILDVLFWKNLLQKYYFKNFKIFGKPSPEFIIPK